MRVLITVIVAAITVTPCIANAVDWPNDANVAVTLTFDLDAETVWWSDAETMTGNPSSLSQGQYGPKVAVPKILALLDNHDIKATFFIPAWVAGHYPDTVRAIAAAGHEIAAHGVKHVAPVNLTPEQERQVLRDSIRVLQGISGRRPVGYRAPSWAFSSVTLAMAVEEGFRYSSNLMDADVPYIHDDPPGMVELPVSWVLDDAPYFWFDEDSWDKTIHSAQSVQANWREEFAAAYDTGGYFGLTMHPQIIGRPARIRMLDELITWVETFDRVWFATGSEVAAHISKE